MSKNNENQNSKIWNRSLDDIMSESFGKYAKYIIQDRALPDIRDGLKPVQRRILYAMNELKIHYDKPYKKSARTVGEVIGKYHPHGDSSIYEAMVRMAQEWKNNIPLLDMQGNKGSIDGDGPAAMRYTEARLSKFGQYMMDDIDKQTVKFIPNFDDSESEPSVLPSLLPNILINGATGIAAGYATNIPPFNFSEVIDGIIYKINNPDSNLNEISNIILGPDFPTGGIIIGKDGIEDIFKTGKGKFFIRARIEEEPVRSTRKIKRLIVKEIPYDTNKSNIVKALDELRINNEIPGFKEVRDDSDKNGVSILLEFETDKDSEIIKTVLYKKTQLQISYTANIVLIKDRKPVQAGLLDILDSFISHANEIVIKAATYDLNKALARKEILEGLIKAISEIDVLINLIKSSTSKDEAKQKIENYFKVNERQSEAIVNLRLYVLTSYDTEKLKKEYSELLEFIATQEKLINSTSYRNKHICNILNEFKKELGHKRRSLLEEKVEQVEINTEDIVERIDGTCIVTKDNYIKFINDPNLDNFDLTRAKLKDTDLPVDMFKMSTLDYLVCFTNRGKCITIPAHKIKMTRLRENGIHINDLVTIDSFEKTILAFAINKNSDIDTKILVATKNSLIKRMLIQDITLSKNAKSLSYINLKNGDEVINGYILNDSNKEIISLSENGYGIKYNIDEIPIVGRTAAGVKNMSLKAGDSVAAVVPIPSDENFLFIVSNRAAKRIHVDDVVQTTRAKLGKKVFNQVESNPYVVNWAAIVGGRTSIYLHVDTKVAEIKVSDIPISDVSTRMNALPGIDSQVIRASFIELNRNIVLESKTNNFATMQASSLKSKTKSLSVSKDVDEEFAKIVQEEKTKNKKEFVLDLDDEGNIKDVKEKQVELYVDEEEIEESERKQEVVKQEQTQENKELNLFDNLDDEDDELELVEDDEEDDDEEYVEFEDEEDEDETNSNDQIQQETTSNNDSTNNKTDDEDSLEIIDDDEDDNDEEYIEFEDDDQQEATSNSDSINNETDDEDDDELELVEDEEDDEDDDEEYVEFEDDDDQQKTNSNSDIQISQENNDDDTTSYDENNDEDDDELELVEDDEEDEEDDEDDEEYVEFEDEQDENIDDNQTLIEQEFEISDDNNSAKEKEYNLELDEINNTYNEDNFEDELLEDQQEINNEDINLDENLKLNSDIERKDINDDFDFDAIKKEIENDFSNQEKLTINQNHHDVNHEDKFMNETSNKNEENKITNNNQNIESSVEKINENNKSNQKDPFDFDNMEEFDEDDDF